MGAPKQPRRRPEPPARAGTPAGPPPTLGRLKRVGILVALLLVFGSFLLSSLKTVHPGERVVLVRRTGVAETLAPGRHLVIPILERLVRIPADPLSLKEEVAIRSSEGVDLKSPFTLTASIPDVRLADLLKSGEVEEPIAWLRQAARVSLASWAAHMSGEALLMGDGRKGAEQSIRDRLQASGFEQVVVTLGPASGPPELQASIAARALKDRILPTGARVAIIGLDGADWEIINPLIARGLLPNLARLKARGAWGNMKSMNPMLSPLLWTTVATGKPPEEHGIIDFLVKDSRTGKPVPVSSRGRRVKALWNILTDAGKSSAFIAWWATWPAEQVNGYMVSDRAAYSLFSFVEGKESDRAGATWPADYFQAIRPRLIDASQIKDADLRPFADATPEEFRRLAAIVASARSYQAVALDLLSRGQPDLFSIYYEGIDEVCHRYAHFMPPKMAMASDEEYRRYKGTVESYYRYQDSLMGDVLARLAPDTNIIVLSDHGFRNGTGRPTDEPPYIEGKPGMWHRRYGIVILAGPAIRPGSLDTTSLLDMAPTILYLLGLPQGEDMHGRVLEEAVDPGFLKRFPHHTLPSYEILMPRSAAGQDLQADSGVDKEMMEKLRSLGYIGAGESASGDAAGAPDHDHPADSGAEGEALVTAHINAATIHLKNKDYPEAEAELAEALRIAPDLITGLILKAQIAADQKQYPLAIATCKRIVALDPAGERQTYGQMARIYAESGRNTEGVAALRELGRTHPEIAEIHAALGSLLLKSGDKTLAEQELLRSLQINPALGDPLAELYTLYRGTDKIPTLEEIVRKGLAIDDQSIVHHNWMGLIYEWQKDLPRAEMEFRRAMELDPDYAATMANLGAMYGRSGRLPEAVAILQRAVKKDEDNLEAWVNLGAAQGRLNHSKEAIVALETARRKGARSTTLYNALALAYLQDRQKQKALEYLKESLVLDPNQKDARELLEAVSRSS